MPTVDNEIDAHFYELIHQLAGSQRERRGHPRQPFDCTHQVAPYDGRNVPHESKFADVRCHDLTRAGFSFLMSHRPDHSSLVAAFGNEQTVIYVEAEVLRCEDVLFFPSTGQVERVVRGKGPIRYTRPNGQIGEPMTLVGCKFLRRLDVEGGC